MSPDLKWHEGRLSYHLTWVAMGAFYLFTVIAGLTPIASLWDAIAPATIALAVITYALDAHRRETHRHRILRRALKVRAKIGEQP